jgi:O-antigen/teichoic acid export membrane protein
MRLVLVAAVLPPSELGLASVAAFAVGAVDLVTQSGIHQAIVQRRRVGARELNVGWTIGVLRGASLTLCLALGAAPVADFFHAPDAVPLLRLLGLAPLLHGLGNIGVSLLDRDLDFRRRLGYQVGATAADMALSVALVLALRSSWGLALGITGGHVARLVLSYALHPYRPRVAWDRDVARDLLGFGRWITLSWWFVLVAFQGPEAVVGRVLGAASLAIFQVANRLGDLPAAEVTNMLAVVAFPAFARLQDDRAAVAGGYLRALRVVCLVTMLLAATLGALAAPLTQLLFLPEWRELASVLAILAVGGALRSIASLGTPLFLGTNRARIEAGMQLTRALVLVAAVVPLTLASGTNGAAAASVLATASTIPIGLWGSCRASGLPARTLASGPLAAAALAACAALVMRACAAALIAPGSDRLVLGGAICGSAAAGWATFALLAVALDRSGMLPVLADLRDIMRASLLGTPTPSSRPASGVVAEP